MTLTQNIKEARTEHPVMDLIRNRWSPRSFSERDLSEETLATILEAAGWAPSANNEQPWIFYPALRGTERHAAIAEALMPGNRIWASKAAAFVVTVGRTRFEANEKPNGYSEHDLGLATAFLVLQARELEVFSHIMAGVEKDKLAETLHLPEDQKILTVIALGYPDDPEKLEEPFRTRELTPRTRKPLHEFVR